MPVVTNANAYSFGIHKQTNEATVGTVADYSLPVFDSNLSPQYDLRRVDVTDASSIEGDPYKGPTSWAGTVTVPGMPASLGTILQGLWPTDTATGTAPSKIHTFSGLGGTQSWMALYEDFTNASKPMTYAKGLCSSLTFTADAGGGPLKVAAAYVGQTPSQAAFTVTTPETIAAQNYFMLQMAGATVEVDNDTPDVNPTTAITNVQDVSITVSRNVEPSPTVDSVTVANLHQGKVTTAGTLTFLYSTWQEYLATYFGSVSGTAVSATIVYGALDLTFKHTTVATSIFELYVPKVQFNVPRPSPNPDGSALTQSVTLNMAAPASGDRVQPILTNNVTPAY
jgi:hypothetical protein